MNGTVVGYLRRYKRWNGTPGLTLGEQRAWVRAVAKERGYGRGAGRFDLMEREDGEATGWPVLERAIQRAEDNKDRDLLVVVPTLDGLHFNLSFLGLLRQCDATVYVRSGRRRLGVIGKNTNYGKRLKTLGWLLSIAEEAALFREMVDGVARRNRALSGAIQIGLAEAADRGVPLGSRRAGAYRFTADDRSTGGRKTACNRRRDANEPYKKWVPLMLDLRRNGSSFNQIALELSDRKALTSSGGKFGPMLIHRIIKRTEFGGLS